MKLKYKSLYIFIFKICIYIYVLFFPRLVISMGFSASESRLALRACDGDVTIAVGYISRKREVSC